MENKRGHIASNVKQYLNLSWLGLSNKDKKQIFKFGNILAEKKDMPFVVYANTSDGSLKGFFIELICRKKRIKKFLKKDIEELFPDRDDIDEIKKAGKMLLKQILEEDPHEIYDVYKF